MKAEEEEKWTVKADNGSNGKYNEISHNAGRRTTGLTPTKLKQDEQVLYVRAPW